jgi:hypothetical protein
MSDALGSILQIWKPLLFLSRANNAQDQQWYN